ncbi:MAG: hypothetical protein M1546_21690 [Chloroflexi bacterium]|nr:hypothetical protein [Chloroflexota bacterium]
MPKTNFSPTTNGFRFANRFLNHIVKLPVYGDITTAGRCGGMSYAALDCYFSGVPVPPQSESDFASSGGVPADGTPLADYIYRRQIESFLVPSAAKFIIWSLTPDESTFFRRGVLRWTKEDEFAKLRKAIDANTPATLGLVVANELIGLARNHQVVAYGYDYDAASECYTVHIYDNNHPGKDVTLKSDKTMPHFQQSTGEKWRGFFVQDYLAQRPPAAGFPPGIAKAIGAEVSPATPAGKRRPGRLTVQFETVTFHADGAPEGAAKIALLFSVNGRASRWPRSGLRSVKSGRTYVIKKSFTVNLLPDASLSLAVSGLEPIGEGLPVVDNDEPVAVMSRTFAGADKWGRGRHRDRSIGPLGAYTISYSVKSGK